MNGACLPALFKVYDIHVPYRSSSSAKSCHLSRILKQQCSQGNLLRNKTERGANAVKQAVVYRIIKLHTCRMTIQEMKNKTQSIKDKTNPILTNSKNNPCLSDVLVCIQTQALCTKCFILAGLFTRRNRYVLQCSPALLVT